MAKSKLTLEERFWSKVRKGKEDECWNWTAFCDEGGYGRIKVNRENIQAHRYSYQINIGEIPEDMDVLHACKNNSCVNPNHLYLRPKNIPVEERFWEKVNREGKSEDDCWEWNACLNNINTKNDVGYGSFKDPNKGKNVFAHRYSYELHKGPIPEGLLVMHQCNNPPCVNPKHLKVGTQYENIKYAASLGRMPGGPGQPAGEKHAMAKLTVDDIREIRRLNNIGITGRDIAKKFDISPPTVCNIVKKKSWKHID